MNGDELKQIHEKKKSKRHQMVALLGAVGEMKQSEGSRDLPCWKLGAKLGRN